MLATRVFWAMALVLQLGILVAPHAAVLQDRGIHGPSAIVSACLVVLCAPLAGLVLQRAVLRHNFWAGAFGVSVVSLAPLGFAFVRGLDGTSPAASQVFGAIGVVALLLSVFGQFIYVYGSPHLWGLRGETPEPARIAG